MALSLHGISLGKWADVDSMVDFFRDAIDDFYCLLLKILKLLPLSVSTPLCVISTVVSLGEHLLDSTQSCLVFLFLISSEFFINLEENDLEWVLFLQQIHNLEVLLIELCLRLQDQKFEDLHDLLIGLVCLCNSE